MYIVVKQRTRWGTQECVPVCEHAKKLAQFAGIKSFSMDRIAQIRSMGINITLEDDPAPTWADSVSEAPA